MIDKFDNPRLLFLVGTLGFNRVRLSRTALNSPSSSLELGREFPDSMEQLRNSRKILNTYLR